MRHYFDLFNVPPSQVLYNDSQKLVTVKLKIEFGVGGLTLALNPSFTLSSLAETRHFLAKRVTQSTMSQKTYQERRNTLIEALNNVPGIEVSMPAGAFYCLVKLPVEDCDDFAQWLLESFEHEGKTLMVAPASGFYGNRVLGKSLIRIAYVLEASKLVESAKLLAMALASYPKTLQTSPAQ